MRIPITNAVDPDTLAAQFTTSLGIPVAVNTRDPGQVDDQGAAIPGVVVLVDPATGGELPDQDAVRVAAVIAAHVVPVVKTPHRALADAITSANNVGDVKAALLAFAGTVAAGEDQKRQKPLKHPHGGH
jgi:hypothetical protein